MQSLYLAHDNNDVTSGNVIIDQYKKSDLSWWKPDVSQWISTRNSFRCAGVQGLWLGLSIGTTTQVFGPTSSAHGLLE